MAVTIATAIAKSKPIPAAYMGRKGRVCRICGVDISNRGRRAFMCLPCAIEMEIHNDRQTMLKVRLVEAKIARGKKRSVGIEYEHQYHSKDGSGYIIPFRNTTNFNVAKICQDCGKTDKEVQGWWGPIFSSMDDRGRETVPVLLCLVCYMTACEAA